MLHCRVDTPSKLLLLLFQDFVAIYGIWEKNGRPVAAAASVSAAPPAAPPHDVYMYKAGCNTRLQEMLYYALQKGRPFH